MKISKTSTVARVPASLKFAALAACLFVPASMFAGADSGYSRSLNSWEKSLNQRTARNAASSRAQSRPDDFAKSTPAKAESEKLSSSVSVKAFYGLGLEELLKGMKETWSSPEIDVSGLTIEYTKNFCPYVDFVSAVNIGVGSRDYSYSESLSTVEEKISVAALEAEVGLNLSVPIFENTFSLFAGPRIGVNLLYVRFTSEVESSSSYEEWDEKEAELGLLFGGDVGAVISFSESSALVLGVGYRKSTAKPFAGKEEQAWVRFSAGCRFSF